MGRRGIPITKTLITERSCPEPNTGCWLWDGAEVTGYGRVGTEGSSIYAHRASWIVYYGPIPEGAMVLHKCDTRLCVNPAHLELGDAGKNMRDCVSRGRHYKTKITTCPQGHEYTQSNTYVRKSGGRHCRECHRLVELNRRAARR